MSGDGKEGWVSAEALVARRSVADEGVLFGLLPVLLLAANGDW